MIRHALSPLCLQRSLQHVTSPTFTSRPLHTTKQRHSAASMHAIKELRKRTGAPIGAVKKALDEEKGDMEAAIVYLRKIGASIAAKKAHRDASEGLIGIAISPDKSRASIIEVNSETDFVARTPQFVQLVNRLTESALNKGRVADCNTMISLDTQQLLEQDENKEMVLGAVSSLGENIVLKRANVMTLDSASGALFGYTHGSAGIGSGRIGALVALKGGTLHEAGPRMAMHIAAAAPSYISIGSIPPQDLERERSILLEAALAEQKVGDKPKPPAILERMAHGRLRKWYASSVLEEQEMLVDNPSYSGEPRAVKEFLKKETADSEIVAMCRMVVGEK